MAFRYSILHPQLCSELGRAVCVVLFLAHCGCAARTLTPAASPNEDTTISDATELYRRGQAAASQGDTVRAEQYLSMALERGYDDKQILPVMLRVCLSSNRLRAALNHAERYLREHPSDQSLRYLVATLHLSLGQVEQARIDLSHLIRVDPKNGKAHYLLGVLESASATPERASEHLRIYLQLSPGGEHAAEVQSRLTDLAVRTELEPLAARDYPAALSRTASAPPAPAAAASAWFGETAETKSVSTGEGVLP
jgi:tetratricopeptide (TPR) repeat protein